MMQLWVEHETRMLGWNPPVLLCGRPMMGRAFVSRGSACLSKGFFNRDESILLFLNIIVALFLDPGSHVGGEKSRDTTET